MKLPMTVSLMWAMSFVLVALFWSETMAIYGSFMVVGIHLGLDIMSLRSSKWLNVQLTGRKKDSGAVPKPCSSETNLSPIETRSVTNVARYVTGKS